MASAAPTPQVLIVEPTETIKFNGPYSETVTSELKLTNPTSDPVAFKVKTTAPRRYAVRPNSGELQGGETANIAVMRQPFEYDPSERHKHKFMIQSVKLLPGQTLNTVWSDADPSTFMDTKLRVQFDDIPPSNRTNVEPIDRSVETFEQPVTASVPKMQQSNEYKSSVTPDEFFRVTSENERLSKEIVNLKDEGKDLRKHAASCTSGGMKMKLPEGIALLFHEKKNILLILLLLVISFAVGIVMSGKVGDNVVLPTK